MSLKISLQSIQARLAQLDTGLGLELRQAVGGGPRGIGRGGPSRQEVEEEEDIQSKINIALPLSGNWKWDVQTFEGKGHKRLWLIIQPWSGTGGKGSKRDSFTFTKEHEDKLRKILTDNGYDVPTQVVIDEDAYIYGFQMLFTKRPPEFGFGHTLNEGPPSSILEAIDQLAVAENWHGLEGRGTLVGNNTIKYTSNLRGSIPTAEDVNSYIETFLSMVKRALKEGSLGSKFSSVKLDWSNFKEDFAGGGKGHRGPSTTCSGYVLMIFS